MSWWNMYTLRKARKNVNVAGEWVSVPIVGPSFWYQDTPQRELVAMRCEALARAAWEDAGRRSGADPKVRFTGPVLALLGDTLVELSHPVLNEDQLDQYAKVVAQVERRGRRLYATT